MQIKCITRPKLILFFYYLFPRGAFITAALNCSPILLENGLHYKMTCNITFCFSQGLITVAAIEIQFELSDIFNWEFFHVKLIICYQEWHFLTNVLCYSGIRLVHAAPCEGLELTLTN